MKQSNIKQSVTICFPTYNEQGNIHAVIDECINMMRALPYTWDILVVDNCSTDDTLKIVDGFSRTHKNIGYIKHKENRGYARSTRTAFENAKGEIIFVIDSDGQQTAKDIPKFIDKINEGYDIVVGWKVHRKDSAFRIIISKVYNIIFNLLFNTKYHDVDCGFRALTREAARKIKIVGFDVPVGAELFAKAKNYGMRTTELPVKHFSRKKGQSVFIPWKMPFTISKIFLSLIVLRLKIKPKR